MLSVYLAVPNSNLWIGNIDPVDPRRLKIPFSYWGSMGEIIGRIGDDDEVDLDIPDVDGLLSRLNPACRSQAMEYYTRSFEYLNRNPER